MNLYLSTICGINIPYIAYCDSLAKKVTSTQCTQNGNSAKWIHDWFDFWAAKYYIKKGELTRKDWILSLIKGKKAFALFSIKDPGPFLFYLKQIFSNKVNRWIRRIKCHWK